MISTGWLAAFGVASVLLSGCSVTGDAGGERSQVDLTESIHQRATKNPISDFGPASLERQPIARSTATQISIEVEYVVFLSETPHVATYRLQDGKLEIVWHKGDRPTRQWSATDQQLQDVRAVIDSVEDSEWNGVYWDPVLDGGMVVCKIVSGESEHKFQGLNAFPQCFTELLGAMDSIADEMVGGFWEMPRGIHLESWEAMEEMDREQLKSLFDEANKMRSP